MTRVSMASDMPPGFFSDIHSRTLAALFEWTMSKKTGFCASVPLARALLARALILRHECLSIIFRLERHSRLGQTEQQKS